jgi:hypothetical protein
MGAVPCPTGRSGSMAPRVQHWRSGSMAPRVQHWRSGPVTARVPKEVLNQVGMVVCVRHPAPWPGQAGALVRNVYIPACVRLTAPDGTPAIPSGTVGVLPTPIAADSQRGTPKATPCYY